MTENQQRRRARRQPRGLLRADAILAAAGAVFADIGYDKATTNLIAARAGVSPGSLYQFFSNKEAIAQAYAAAATARLHEVYDTILAPDVITLPLREFLDTFIDALMVFNREYPGYLALSVASTISAPLALALADLRRGIDGRIEATIAALWPEGSAEERRIRGLVSYRLFLALLPLALSGPEDDQPAIVREMKTVLYRYWAPHALTAADELSP
jgi:AcrR family transcriptional regulator